MPVLLYDLKPSFVGCLLGLALGDALGAPLEGGPIERILWRLIGKTSSGQFRWTDDTQMALDIAESVMACRGVDLDDIAFRFSRSYHWSRGYGPGAARVLKLIRLGVDWRSANTRVYPDGSFGNGGAMRAPVVGLVFLHDLDSLRAQARATAAITHAHPLGQEGAVLVALTIALTVGGEAPSQILRALLEEARLEPFRVRLEIASSWGSSRNPSPDVVRMQLGNGIAATESSITAIYLGLRFLDSPFSSLLEFVAACRGDVDTIGAIAGAIWGARNGDSRLPADRLALLEDAERIQEIALDLHRVVVDMTEVLPRPTEC